MLLYLIGGVGVALTYTRAACRAHCEFTDWKRMRGRCNPAGGRRQPGAELFDIQVGQEVTGCDPSPSPHPAPHVQLHHCHPTLNLTGQAACLKLGSNYWLTVKGRDLGSLLAGGTLDLFFVLFLSLCSGRSQTASGVMVTDSSGDSLIAPPRRVRCVSATDYT